MKTYQLKFRFARPVKISGRPGSLRPNRGSPNTLIVNLVEFTELLGLCMDSLKGKSTGNHLMCFYVFFRWIIGAFRFNLSLEPNHWVHSDDVNLLKRVANGNQPTITITRWAPPVLT